jgi:hypothetical protein
MADPNAIDRLGSAFAGAVDARGKGTVRNKDIQNNVLNAASVIAQELSRQTGKQVTAQITSGGQPTRGIAGLTRTGSARHNEGYALDFVLAVNGSKVRPADAPGLYAQAAKVAAQRGMQGIGVYSHSMHIGTPIGTPQSSIGRSRPETFWNGTNRRNRAPEEVADVVRQGYVDGLQARGILGMPTPRPTGPAQPPAVPTPAPRQQSAAPARDFRAPPSPLTITPNKVQTFNFTPANIDPARFAPGPSPAELAAQYGSYQRSGATVPQARGSATGSVAESPRGVASGSLSLPGRATVNIDRDRFTNFVNTPSVPMPNAYQAPSAIGQGAMSNAGTDNRGSIGPGNQAMVNLERSLMRPDTFAIDNARFAPSPSVAELANQYSQYGNRAPSRSSAPVQNLVDIPNSAASTGRLSLADQYASYGAGRLAPQVASSATQATPSVTRSMPSIPGPAAPAINAPMTQQQRMDKALADMRVGIPPQDIYDENAPGRSGFRGFGAGGFLGNLLTGNIGNMRGIEGGMQLPGLLGVLQNVVQGLGGPQQAAQAVQTVAPALGQVMGLPAAQQAAKAGNNMVIGRDAAGRIGWMADGGLSAGAQGAGWASNNPERNYGGYGGGYDPTPV